MGCRTPPSLEASTDGSAPRQNDRHGRVHTSTVTVAVLDGPTETLVASTSATAIEDERLASPSPPFLIAGMTR
jgi:hypothetical protein